MENSAKLLLSLSFNYLQKPKDQEIERINTLEENATDTITVNTNFLLIFLLQMIKLSYIQ
jgi:hypothetical protein